MEDLPIIDLRARDAASLLDGACRQHGFFVIVGHGVDRRLFDRLDASAREFFARPSDEKSAIDMSLGGTSWRGWFPPGGELTSGVPDGKEGIYFGREDGPDHPRVRSGTPLHGRNLFPPDSDLDAIVLEVLDVLTDLGHRLCSLIAQGLGLDPSWFAESLTADPTILFRIFHYPKAGTVGGAEWGVQEHTDYGLLTILRQDEVGGLEVRGPDGWSAAPPVEDSFVCNIGDMLERMTGGVYRSTAHRVRQPSRSRLSFPFFFDPSWDAEIVPVPGLGDTGASAPARWDGRSVFDFDGTYGDYLTERVARVFPELWRVIDRP
ncbi:isopenicillin N synthase family dioxygenase [Actinospongicola halichondriae]|uniref:isopenicillin N synthase family dioxygenase n=1 Tax=Actinospongicola halichondriae TaxID=3236844 RepID=UPI003D397F57